MNAATANGTSHMMGNTNALIGAMHKGIIADRLAKACDPLAQAVARMAGIGELADSCCLRNGESAGAAESGSEVAMIALGADGSEAIIDVMAKTCSGFGTSNQTSRFWARSLMLPSEIDTPAGRALQAICGSLDAQAERSPRSTPGQLVAHDFAKTGLPLQKWLGQESALERVALRAFGVEAATARGAKLLLLSMRAAMDSGEDLHILVDRADLRDFVTANAASLAKDGTRFVKIGINDEAIELTPILRLKRKGGDSGASNSDQLQTSISPSEILRAVANKSLRGHILREEPTEASLTLSALARADKAASTIDPHAPISRIAKANAKILEAA